MPRLRWTAPRAAVWGGYAVTDREGATGLAAVRLNGEPVLVLTELLTVVRGPAGQRLDAPARNRSGSTAATCQCPAHVTRPAGRVDGHRHRGGVLALGSVYALLVRPRLLRWGASDDEPESSFPGADLVPGGVRRGRQFDPAGRRPRRYTDSTWGFLLTELPGRRTRLLVGGYWAFAEH